MNETLYQQMHTSCNRSRQILPVILVLQHHEQQSELCQPSAMPFHSTTILERAVFLIVALVALDCENVASSILRVVVFDHFSCSITSLHFAKVALVILQHCITFFTHHHNTTLCKSCTCHRAVLHRSFHTSLHHYTLHKLHHISWHPCHLAACNRVGFVILQCHFN